MHPLFSLVWPCVRQGFVIKIYHKKMCQHMEYIQKMQYEVTTTFERRHLHHVTIAVYEQNFKFHSRTEACLPKKCTYSQNPNFPHRKVFAQKLHIFAPLTTSRKDFSTVEEIWESSDHWPRKCLVWVFTLGLTRKRWKKPQSLLVQIAYSPNLINKRHQRCR